MVLNNSEDIYAVIDKSRKSPEKTLEKKVVYSYFVYKGFSVLGATCLFDNLVFQ